MQYNSNTVLVYCFSVFALVSCQQARRQQLQNRIQSLSIAAEITRNPLEYEEGGGWRG